jgi:tRNA threonylcarbamoyladenosine biosynthesis protein TsaE
VPVLSREALVVWGEALGRTLRAPRVITLSGDLGAGKTTLAQAICRGYGVTEPVTSPTFALVHEYAGGATPVHHLDLYRLRDRRDLLQLGWEELVHGDTLVLVEWPERAEGEIPPGAMHLVLRHVAGDESVREVTTDA